MGPGRDWLTSEKNIMYMLNTSISCTTEITTRPIASTSINSIKRTMQNIGMSTMRSDAHSTTNDAVTFYSSRNRIVPPARCAI